MDTKYIMDGIDIPGVRVSGVGELNENNKIPQNGRSIKNTKNKNQGNYLNYKNLIFLGIFIAIIFGTLKGYKIFKDKEAGSVSNIKRLASSNVGIGTKTKTAQVKKTFKNDKLNDLFAIKYKPNKAKLPLRSSISPTEYNSYMPLQLPDFSMGSRDQKIKRLKPGEEDNFTVLAYSNGFVVVKCGKAIYYLKAGEESCGRTLLRTGSSSSVFSHNKKFKKVVY